MSWRRKIRRIRNITDTWIEKIVSMNTLPELDIELFYGYENELAVYEKVIDDIYADLFTLFEDRVANQDMIVYIFRSLDGILPFDDIVCFPRNSPESIRALAESVDFPHMNRFITEYYIMIDEILIPQTIAKFNDIALAFVQSPLSGDNVCEILSFLRSETELLSKHEIDCIVYSRM
jgi:hypothetical protein